MEAQALFFQFETDDRTAQIRRFMRRHHILCNFIERPKYLQTLGALAGLPGFPENAPFYMGAPLADEMLVLSGWSDDVLDEFLLFLRENNWKPITHKAVLTPVSSHWNVLQLFEELDREARAVRR